MPRFRLTLAYDGTAFHGWQRQDAPANHLTHAASAPSPRVLPPHPDDARLPPNRLPLRTVQAVLERAIFDLTHTHADTLGASRTDAGVHAAAQTAAFTLPDDARRPPDDRLADALNTRLPEDVLVLHAAPTREDFDPIADCTAKGYRYTIHAHRTRPLWDRAYAAHVRTPLDTHAMRDAAQAIVGTHDFAAFTNAGHGRESTVRTVFHCDVSDTTHPRTGAQRIAIDVSGDGFLYNMVRIIAGTLTDAGKHRLSPDHIRAALNQPDRRATGPTMPPEGLRLEWIRYPDDQPDTQ